MCCSDWTANNGSPRDCSPPVALEAILANSVCSLFLYTQARGAQEPHLGSDEQWVFLQDHRASSARLTCRSGVPVAWFAWAVIDTMVFWHHLLPSSFTLFSSAFLLHAVPFKINVKWNLHKTWYLSKTVLKGESFSFCPPILPSPTP